MSSLHGYTFNNMGGLKSDMTDKTEQNTQNTRFGNYSVSNFFSNSASDSQVQFATQHNGMIVNNKGVAGQVIDIESTLLNKVEGGRPTEKLQLFQRPFSTVPYLGRGGGNPTLEAQLQQGQMVRDLKSVSTISETSYKNEYPMLREVQQDITNPNKLVQELAMDGWIRGGASARENSNAKGSK
jgi:hypothetical protein